MVLKDIKNDPSVGGGLKRPLSSLKRRMSEPGCLSLLPCKSKFGKDDVGQDNASAALGSEQNQNIGTDLTNAPLSLQERERNGSRLSKIEISGLSGLKINDGVISPVISKANLPHDELFSSLSYSPSTVSGVSNMSLSYFADPTAPNENEEQDSTETSVNSDKFFSTPMPSRERVKQKLAPIMEVDIESNMSDDWHTQEKRSLDLLDKKSYTTDVLSHESPTKTPLYRSFFAAECQEIVNQIENIVTDVITPSKRKMEEVDVSTIDAEPPPYDSTPMKSMLACEVSKMIGSLENSPIQEGLSKFGESLLDLEKTDMQLDDFNLSECQIKNDTGRSASDAEGLSLSDGLDGVCSKKQKTEPCKANVCNVNQESKISSTFYISAASKSGDERRSHVMSNNLLHTEQELSDSVMILGMAAAQVVSQVQKSSPQSLVIATNSPVHKGPSTTSIMQMGRADEHNLCANSTQDIEVTYDELQLTDALLNRVNSKASTDPSPSITSIHEESIMANATRVIEIFPPTSNTTQDLPFIQEEANLANTTKMIEMVELPSANKTLDLSSLHNDSNSGNTVQVMVAVSANTTHIIPGHEDVAPANTTQNIDVAPQILANTTQDIPSTQESKAANTAHVIEVVPQSCINAAQDNVPMYIVATPAITTQVEIVPKASSDGALGTTSTWDDSIPTYCTHDAGVMQKSSVDVPRADEAQTAVVGVTCVTTNPCTLVSPPGQANPNVTEGQKLERSNQSGSNCGPEMTASQTEVDVCKVSVHQPLLSESYSMIQEEENAHDISVFSVGSLSFVTSTPVPGLNDFQYQKTVMDPVHQDPSISIGSVLDESANKVSGVQRMNNAQGLNCKEKREMPHGSSIPLRMQRGMAPPSEMLPKPMTSTSGIPSARRSLALYQNASQNPAMEPAVSKIAHRGGIPGRGVIRPPVVRQSLPRASLGNPKQAMEGIGGSSMMSKPAAGSRFRTPKAAAGKVKSATANAQLPPVTSSVKPPSRLGVPCTNRQLSTAGQNAETVLGGRPPMSTGIGRGLPKPGTSSVCPTLPQSQKVSLKLKSQVQGLATKKNQRELLTLGSHREIGAQAEDTSVRSSTKQPPLALGSTTEASCSLNQTVQIKAVTLQNEQCSRSSKSDVSNVPAVSIVELADSGLDQCRHLEMCKCCQVSYRQLLQENEDLKKCLGLR